MAIYQIDVQGVLGTEYFTNVWHVNASGYAQALGWADAIAEVTADQSHADVVIDKARVALYPLNGGQGTVRSYALQGGQGNYDYLPLWNVVRIDYQPALGRPSRKYMRFPVNEGVQVKGVLSAGQVAAYQAGFVNGIGQQVTGLCDIHGQPFVDARVFATVGMRQLRRGSKRRTQPIIS